MENNSLHKLGIDIGSTTVKIALLDADDNILFSDYERHFANIQETLASSRFTHFSTFISSYSLLIFYLHSLLSASCIT